jgi:hypothetical protein
MQLYGYPYVGPDWVTANALSGLQAASEGDEVLEQASMVSLDIDELERVITWARRLEEIAAKRIEERKAEVNE